MRLLIVGMVTTCQGIAQYSSSPLRGWTNQLALFKSVSVVKWSFSLLTSHKVLLGLHQRESESIFLMSTNMETTTMVSTTPWSMLHVTATIPKFQCHSPTPVCNNGWARPYEESQDMSVFIQIQRVQNRHVSCHLTVVIATANKYAPFARFASSCD